MIGRRPTRFGTHSIKPHSSFNGTTLCKKWKSSHKTLILNQINVSFIIYINRAIIQKLQILNNLLIKFLKVLKNSL